MFIRIGLNMTNWKVQDRWARFIVMIGFVMVWIKPAHAQIRKLHFVQYADTIQPVSGAIEVERDYFEMRITLKKGDEVILNMSADSTNYHQANRGVPLDSFIWFQSGTGMLDHPEYRPNWLLFNSHDYMRWVYQPGKPNTKLYRDSLVTDGYAVNYLITSFNFSQEGALDGMYSVFIVPVTWLYFTYYVSYKGCFGRRKKTALHTVKVRMMGN